MNPLIVCALLVLLVALLMLLGRWQSKVEEVRRERVVAEIKEAKDVGSDQAIAQHPQIDSAKCVGCGSCIAACPEDGVIGLVDGIAQVVHLSRCIGHGVCAVACPVDAITIGLGDTSKRTDLPVLTESLETTVPGVFIAGELGGFALIRLAVEQGTKVVDEIARGLVESGRGVEDDGAVDVLIVGAGPAGLAATLRCIERRLSYATIDQEDLASTIRKYPRRKLTLTGPMKLPLHGEVERQEFLKEELIEFIDGLVDEYGMTLRTHVKLLGLERRGELLVAQTSDGDIAARRVVLALGRRGTPRKLGVPGEEQEKVLYQLVDAATYSDEHILVVGGGDSAIEAATGLAEQRGNVVTVSYRRKAFFRLKSRNRERIEEFAAAGKVRLIFNSNVQSIGGRSVTLTCEQDGVSRNFELENDYVFVLAGGEPPYPILRGMGVRFGGDEEAPVNDRQTDPVGAAS